VPPAQVSSHPFTPRATAMCVRQAFKKLMELGVPKFKTKAWYQFW
jgi:hypothetical protein